jgi:hypothetical protein
MKQRPHHSSGFSLILSLMVMAGIVMLVVTLSAFITIESRAAMNQQLAVRSRLNALVSMRLALAHLQQEAGPDRRSTARADITQPEVIFAYKFRNPMWTGVWRTDRPNQAPSWLVSGNDPDNPGTQSISLAGRDTLPPGSAYPSTYWLPWEMDYESRANDNGFVSLVGAASANPVEIKGGADPIGDKPSGLVVLPKINLREVDANGSDRLLGSFAYWIGDEGIKARINLEDPRLALPATDNGARSVLRSAATTAVTLIKGAEALTDDTQARFLGGSRDLGLLDGFDPDPALVRRLFHDVTGVSAGVLADSLNGGLRRDLSLAFELSDAEFTKTEFGSGTAAPATSTENGLSSLKMSAPINGRTLPVSPVFNREVTSGNLRGPTWWALRDYHRMYKQVGWVDGVPTLNARTYFPNAGNIHKGPDNGDSATIKQRNYLYSSIYAGDRVNLNPNITDIATIAESGWPQASAPIPRPFNCAVAPYLERVFLVFNLIKETSSKGTTAYLDITPVFVLHNPYNVALTCQPADGQSALSLTFSEWNSWLFRVVRRTYVYPVRNPFDEIQSKLRTFTYTKNLGDYYRFADANALNDSDLFRVYVDRFTLQPGEHKVFTPTSGARSRWSRVVKLDNCFNYQGGFSDEDVEWSKLWPGFKWYYFDPLKYPPALGYPPSDTFTFEVIPSGKFNVRYALTCWPGDQLPFTTNSTAGGGENAFPAFDLYNKSSEHAVIAYSGIDAKVGLPGPLNIGDIVKMTPEKEPSPGVYQPGIIIAAIELSVKTARENLVATAGTAPTAAGAFPLFTHSNPMAAIAHADGAGRSGPAAGAGFKGASPSYRMRVTRPTGGMNAWISLLQASSDAQPRTYGGFSNEVDGNLSSTHTEVPLVPPTSLGQFAHANFNVRDQQPLYGVGNSFAHPQVDPTKTYSTSNNWTEYDAPFLLNAALWDSYFLSGAAPKMTNVASPATPAPANPDSTSSTNPFVESKPLAEVLDNFVNGIGKLENPRMRLTDDSSDSREALGDYRRSASKLLNDGAFNVNSTSVEAWMVFLGGAKKVALADLAATAPSPQANARFPRAVPTGSAPVAAGAYDDPTKSNWTGFANLTDAQLRLLAAAIVKENKVRFQLSTRTERDFVNAPTSRLFRGLTKSATPYLGLAEFINRFLTPGASNAWATRCGALQAAIFRADNPTAGGPPGAALTDRLTKRYTLGMFDATKLKPPAGLTFPFPQNIEAMEQGGANRTHVAMGTPGNLLQVDLLQSLGASLATRSDTFTIRAYGEGLSEEGNRASCIIEAVVQRQPGFVDDLDPPETTYADLRPTNKLFGRKFKVVSYRWLKNNEN